jgi:hypothetical protein
MRSGKLPDDGRVAHVINGLATAEVPVTMQYGASARRIAVVVPAARADGDIA